VVGARPGAAGRAAFLIAPACGHEESDMTGAVAHPVASRPWPPGWARARRRRLHFRTERSVFQRRTVGDTRGPPWALSSCTGRHSPDGSPRCPFSPRRWDRQSFWTKTRAHRRGRGYRRDLALQGRCRPNVRPPLAPPFAGAPGPIWAPPPSRAPGAPEFMWDRPRAHGPVGGRRAIHLDHAPAATIIIKGCRNLRG
jgi:hypothetical protein